MRILSVVLDTNVVVSGDLKASGNEDAVLNLLYTGQARLSASEDILVEYEAVLARAKFGLDPLKIARFMARVREGATRVSSATRVRACRDPDDDKFLQCALAGRADFLVTGNTKHFPKHSYEGVQIVRPLEFLVAFALSELDRAGG